MPESSALSIHRAGVERLPEEASDWLAVRRREAFDRFASAGGFPTTRHEDWRTTSLKRLAETPFVPGSAAPGARPSVEEIERLSLGLDGALLVFVDGVHDPELSRAADLPAGASVRSLRAARGDEVVERLLGSVASAQDRPLVDLATAYLDDGAVIRIGRGVRVEQPIHVLFFATSDSEPTLTAPRLLLDLDEGAEALVVETHAGRGDSARLGVCVTEASLAAASRLHHVKLVRESEAGHHVGTIDATQDRDSSFASLVFAVGGDLARSEVRTRLAGPGAHAALDGAYVVSGTRHADCRTSVDHAVPHCESRQLYKGVLGGRSRGVFAGRVIVRPQAQKTLAQQTNRNLILSPHALADSMPQLEIDADDVKCAHGSTIGQLDPMELFYLRSRGIDESRARRMLVEAFAQEVVDHVGREDLVEGISPVLEDAMRKATADTGAAS